MRTRPLSIHDILWLTISTLTLIIVLLVGQEVVAQWQKLQKIESLKEATLFSDKLFDATEKLAIERDVAFAMLYAPDAKDTTDLRSRLENSRQEADAAFLTALEPLEEYSFPELDELHQNIERHLAGIRVLRREVDQSIDTPRKQRDDALAIRWYAEVTALANETDDLWLQFIRHFTDINPIVTQHLRYKHFLLNITDYTGRERALIGRLLVENVDPTPEEMGQLLRWQGMIELSWRTSWLLADQSGLYAVIGPYFKDAKSQYMTMHDMIRDVFYMPGSKHGKFYPISVDLWFELSTQCADSLNYLKTVSRKVKHQYIDQLESDTRQAIALHLGLLLLALGLCLYCFHVISRRVIRPINAMVDALVDTAQGKKVSLVPQFVSREDEIGKLADVLHAFQRATATITASESRLRAVVDNALNGIISINKQGIIETFNPRCELIFGYKAEEVIGQNIKMLMPEPYHSQHDGYLHHYNTTGDAKIIGTAGRELTARRKDGSIFPMDLSVSSFPLEDGQHFSGIIRDITDRKLAEQKVAAAHTFLEDMMNHIPDPIFMKDREHRWIGGNKAFWEMMNGSPEQFIGKSDYEFFPKEEADIFWERDNKVLNGDGMDINEEFFTDAKGQKHIFSTKKVAFLDEKGEKFLVGVIRDITEVKEGEAKLLRYTDALERSNKELDDFAYIASHDLKEPLRGIHNHSRFLLEDNKDKLDEDSVRKLDRLVYLSQRMERLVNDLLYFSRLGRQDMAIQTTNLGEIIHDIETTLEIFLEERHARIIIPQPLPTITCDKTRVTELFRNLITNAVKYNDKAEKTVEIGFLPTHTTSNKVVHKNVLYVRDNGKGIAPEFYEEIFRIFKRLQSSKDSAEEGTGVGLTFVKKIVERHGGKIWLESQDNVGTVFYFTLREA